MDRNELREELAALEHDRWVRWMNYQDAWAELFGRRGTEVGCQGESRIDRWKRKAAMPYDQLTEAEKESNRAEADRTLAIIGPLLSHWTPVTPKTPLPDDRDGVVVALNRPWQEPFLAMSGDSHPKDEAANAYAFYRLPPWPDPPKEDRDAANP